MEIENTLGELRLAFGTLKAQANYTDGYGALVLIQLQ